MKRWRYKRWMHCQQRSVSGTFNIPSTGIPDIDYFRAKLFAALQIPPEYLQAGLVWWHDLD